MTITLGSDEFIQGTSVLAEDGQVWVAVELEVDDDLTAICWFAGTDECCWEEDWKQGRTVLADPRWLRPEPGTTNGEVIVVANHVLVALGSHDPSGQDHVEELNSVITENDKLRETVAQWEAQFDAIFGPGMTSEEIREKYLPTL